MAKLFQATFLGKGGEDASVTHGTARDRGSKEVLDELSLDESAHYQQKISKYIRRSLTCTTDPAFWFIMQTSHLVLHFYRFMCIKLNSRRLHLVELVSRAIYNVESEFNSLLQHVDSWTDCAFSFASQVSNLNTDEVEFNTQVMLSVGVALVLQNAATFARRVVRPFSRQGFDTGVGMSLYGFVRQRLDQFSHPMFCVLNKNPFADWTDVTILIDVGLSQLSHCCNIVEFVVGFAFAGMWLLLMVLFLYYIFIIIMFVIIVVVVVGGGLGVVFSVAAAHCLLLLLL